MAPFLLVGKLRLREVKGLGITGSARAGVTTQAHLTPRPPGAALSSASVFTVTQCHTGFSSNQTPVSSHGASSSAFTGIACKALLRPPPPVQGTSEPERGASGGPWLMLPASPPPEVREAGGVGGPSGSGACGSGWPVSGSPSRWARGLGGDRAPGLTAGTASRPASPRGGPAGHHCAASLPGCPLSLALCPSSLWCAVSDPVPSLSPSPRLSLSLSFALSPPPTSSSFSLPPLSSPLPPPPLSL